MLNQFALAGVLVESQSMRTNKGAPMAKFYIETRDRWKDKETGEWQERRNRIEMVCFGPNATGVNKLPNGTMMLISGKVGSNEYEDRNGETRYGLNLIVQDITPVRPGQEVQGVAPVQQTVQNTAPPQGGITPEAMAAALSMLQQQQGGGQTPAAAAPSDDPPWDT